MHHAAVAVVGVLAEADVRNHQEILADDVFQRLDRFRDDTVFAHRVGADRVFRFRNPEEDNAADSELFGFFHFLDEFVDRKLILARHRADRDADADARTDEKGQNETVGGQNRVAG